jgi:Xaa-Pro aminopeptidase
MSAARAAYAMFSEAEMRRRYAAARELMARGAIDALLISGEENFQYFAGTSASIGLHYSLTRPSVFILPANHDPIIVTQGGEAIRLSCHVDDVRGYAGLLQFPHQAVDAALRDAVPGLSRVGVELGQEQRMGVPVAAYLALVADRPGVEFVDAAHVLIELRMSKSAEELRYIRHAADITSRARQRLYDAELRPGISERQAVRTLRRLMLEEGADGMSFCHIQNGLPGHSNPYHYDRPFEKGMLVGMDAGAWVGMYTVDYPRFAVLGAASAEQRRVHDAARTVARRMAEAVRPGMTCAEVFQVGLDACQAAEVEPEARGTGSRMGHGQGMLLTEPPSVAADDHTILMPGVVLSMEPGVTGHDGVSVLWEDVLVVTETGSDRITLEIDDLREVPW